MPLFNIVRLIFLLFVCACLYPFLKNRAFFYFLNFSGPSFIKLGQTLSTRADLVGENLAEILSNFQDKLKPVAFSKVKKEVAKLGNIFQEFDQKACASASIAQVHKAILLDGSEVAVKILRPNIKKIVNRDIRTLALIVKITRIFSQNYAKLFEDINDILKNSAKSELDMLKEAANATKFKQNLQNILGFYIPKIYLRYCSSQILVIEWIDGIPFSDKQRILASNFDKEKLAKNLVLSYFHQVYQDGFFHGDMHPGNLFLIDKGENAGKIAAIDFGIVGQIDKKLRIGLTEIFIGYLDHNYKKVAQIHIDCGLVPKDTDLMQLSFACQKIGEKIVDNNVKDISLALLMSDLISLTSSYKMKTDGNLLLLHKTLMIVEGVGVWLDPKLNIWQIARPWVKEWAKKNIGFDAKIRDFVLDFIDSVKKFARDI